MTHKLCSHEWGQGWSELSISQSSLHLFVAEWKRKAGSWVEKNLGSLFLHPTVGGHPEGDWLILTQHTFPRSSLSAFWSHDNIQVHLVDKETRLKGVGVV